MDSWGRSRTGRLKSGMNQTSNIPSSSHSRQQPASHRDNQSGSRPVLRVSESTLTGVNRSGPHRSNKQPEEAARLTLHLVVEGELLAGVDAARGEQGDSGQPLVDVVDEDVKHLQVGVALQTGHPQG